MDRRVAQAAASVGVAISAALTIIAVAVLVFLDPIWVGFEQARTHADRFTGYNLDDVHRVSNAIVGELIFGPATFLQQVGGVAVFDPRERQHLADVRGVLMAFFGLVVVAIVILIVAAWRARDRQWLWRTVAAGTAVLAGAVVIVGALFAVFFDAAFELFHELLFPSGSFNFDPARERLVQLFPEDFWAETSIALAIVILVLAVGVTWLARRRASVSAAPRPAVQPAVRREGIA